MNLQKYLQIYHQLFLFYNNIILLDNGQIALQPNNRIKWSEPSFVTKPFPEKPDYLVNKDYYNCEGFEKWSTEDSERMFYDNE